MSANGEKSGPTNKIGSLSAAPNISREEFYKPYITTKSEAETTVNSIRQSLLQLGRDATPTNETVLQNLYQYYIGAQAMPPEDTPVGTALRRNIL